MIRRILARLFRRKPRTLADLPRESKLLAVAMAAAQTNTRDR